MPKLPLTSSAGTLAQRVSERAKPLPGGEYVRSLSRGLALLCAFDESNRTLTISQAALAIGVDRATARRLLLTLVEEEFAGTDGNLFYLRPRALQIGFAYLRSSDLAAVCQATLEKFSSGNCVTASAGVMADGEVLYIARSVQQSPVTINIEVGMKVPLYRSSIGRVLLASLAPAAATKYLAGIRADRRTAKSIVDKPALEKAIAEVRKNGYAVVDEELEMGLRTIAVPVVNASGITIASINAAIVGSGATRETLVQNYLKPLLEASRELSLSLK